MVRIGSIQRCWVALAWVLTVCTAAAQGVTSHKPLRFLGNAGVPPMVMEVDGQARGVAVDLALAAAREAGLDIQVQAMAWQQAQLEMQEGRADGLIHINPTPQRELTLAFSDPLLASRFHIYRRRDRQDIRDLVSLGGRRVGVERAGFPAQFLAMHPEIGVEIVTSWKDAFDRLGRGDLDAVFVDQWAGDYALSQRPGSDIVAVEPAVVQDHSRIAVAKGQADLLAALNRGLQAIDRNGTRQAILQRWSGHEVLHLTREHVERQRIVAGGVLAATVAALLLIHALRQKRLNRELTRSRDAMALAVRDGEQANQRLRELMAEQTAMVESQVVGIVKIRDPVIVWANQTFADMFGYRVDELVGHSIRMLFATDEAFTDLKFRLSQTLRSGGRFLGDIEQVRKDGSTGRFSFSAAMLGPGSDLQLGAVVDVTAERAASAALRDALQDLTSLYNDSPVGLHSLGPDGTVLRINDTQLRWLGLTRDEVVGRMQYADLLTPASRPAFDQAELGFRQSGVIKDLRLALMSTTGDAMPVLLNATAVRDEAGRIRMDRSTVVDLTQQVRAQAQMEQAQRMGRIGSWEVDLLSGRIEFSREMRRLFGLPDDVPPGEAFTRQALHPDDRDEAFLRYQRACETGAPLHVRCRVLRPDGVVLHLDSHGECRRDASGRVVGMVGMTQDVTAEVRSAQELALSEQRYAAVVDSQSELISRLRADGTVLLVNPQVCRTFGIDAQAVVGTVWQPQVHPDDLPTVEARLRELSPACPEVVVENRVFTAAQGLRWMEWVHRGFFDEAGRLTERQAVGRDITERRHLQAQLAQQLQLRHTMLDNELVGIVTLRERRIVWANRAFENFLGHAPGEAVGRSTRLDYPSDAAFDSFGARAYPALERGQTVRMRADFVRQDGQRVWADVSGAPLAEPGMSLWVFVDVTARKQAEDELHRHRQGLESLVAERTAEMAAAVELAQAANRAKSEFLAIMSHELRTPMNAILGLTPIVRRRVADPRSQAQLALVEAAGHQLLALIDDILDATRIEADRLRIDRQPLQLADILLRVDAALGAKARQRGLHLGIDAPPSLLTRAMLGDPLRIEQILANLVGNAIKFTEQGSVRLCLSALPAPAGQTLLRVEVIDTGIGIAEADQARVFLLFEQVDSSMARTHGGAGLGLALCRKLVALMGGRIGVDSSLGQGSCFWFEIPLQDFQTPAARHDGMPQDEVLAPAQAGASVDAGVAAQDEVDASALLRRDFGGARVLVVEDDPVNAEVARLMLEDAGLAVEAVADGQAAVARVSAQSYALILMDLQMPGMDGLTATRALRRLPHGRRTCVVALTARALDLDRAQCAQAGLDDVIFKPVVTRAFYRQILLALQRAGLQPWQP